MFDNATSRHSVEVLEDAISRRGAPDDVITDKGSQFYAVDSRCRKKSHNRLTILRSTYRPTASDTS